MSSFCCTKFQPLKPMWGVLCDRAIHKSAGRVVSNMLPKFGNFLGQIKDVFKYIEEFKKNRLGMSEPKCMVIFVALIGIATLLCFEREYFSSWSKLEDAFKKTYSK